MKELVKPNKQEMSYSDVNPHCDEQSGGRYRDCQWLRCVCFQGNNDSIDEEDILF